MGAFIVLALALVPISLSAQTTTPGTGTGASGTGGTTINVFCLDFGKKFPEGQSIKAQGLADDKVRGALQYSLGKGYIQSNPYQVQLAVWNIVDGQPFHDVNNRGTTVAQEIVSNAGNAPAGSAGDVSNITVTNLKAADANAAYGTGAVSGSLPANVPVGFVLPAPDGTFQRLVSVVASTTGQSSTTAQTTPAASGTTSAAGSAAAGTTTTTGTTAAGTTTAAGSAAAGTTTTTGTTAAGTTTAQTTAAATTAPTATTAATSAATATTATSTTAPTATRAATVAPVATGTGGGTVATQAPSTLPATGAARDEKSSNVGLMAALLLTMGVIAMGIVLRRRGARA